MTDFLTDPTHPWPTEEQRLFILAHGTRLEVAQCLNLTACTDGRLSARLIELDKQAKQAPR